MKNDFSEIAYGLFFAKRTDPREKKNGSREKSGGGEQLEHARGRFVHRFLRSRPTILDQDRTPYEKDR